MNRGQLPIEYQVPEGVDPTSRHAIRVLLSQVIASRASFSRQELAQEFIALVAMWYPEAWEAFRAPSDVQLVLTGIRSATAMERRHRAHAQVIAVGAQRVANRLATGSVGDAHYGIGDGRYVQLRNMTRQQLSVKADDLESSGRGQIARARLLRQIAKHLPTPDTPVNEVYSDGQLEAMFAGTGAWDDD